MLGLSGGTIMYVVVFEVLERERSKSISGMIQFTFFLLGFIAMVCIDVFGELKENILEVSFLPSYKF